MPKVVVHNHLRHHVIFEEYIQDKSLVRDIAVFRPRATFVNISPRDMIQHPVASRSCQAFYDYVKATIIHLKQAIIQEAVAQG